MRFADNLTFFSLSLLTFSYQSLMIVYLSSVLAGQMISVILVSLYIAYAFGFLSDRVFSKKTIKKEYLVILQIGSIVLSLILVNMSFLDMYEQIIHTSRFSKESFSVWEQGLSGLLSQIVVQLICILIFPFAVYGVVFGYYLKQYRERFVSVLKIELLSILVANIFCVFFLSYLGWPEVFFLLIIFVILIEFLQQILSKKYFISYLLILAFLVSIFYKQLIPVSNLNISAKDYSAKNNVTLIRESWNFHSRTKTLEVEKNKNGTIQKERLISLDEGTGIARIPRPNQHITTVDFVSLFNPQNILILFAGAGAEMVALTKSHLAPSLQSIDSVELNPSVIKHGLLDSNNLLNLTLEDPRFRLIHSDARVYLEKTKNTYDTILFSWSGATVAHYSGALMHTTQYVFTREALQAAVNRLKENGFLIIFGASKINLITHFREISIEDLDKKLILLESQNSKNWKNSWDDHILIFSKKNLNSKSTLFTDLSKIALENQYSIVVFPEKSSPPQYENHIALIKEKDWLEPLERLRRENGIYFQSHTDDKPFVYSWCQFFDSSRIAIYFSHGINNINWIWLTLLILFTYIFFNRKHLQSQKINWSLSFFCGFLGGFFNFIVFYKAILYMGFPNYALVLSIVLSTAANYCSLVNLNKKLLNGKFYLIFLIAYIPIITYFGLLEIRDFQQALFEFSLMTKIFLIGIFFPAVFFNSFIYNRLLSRSIHNPYFLENVIVLDTIGSCLSVLVTPMLVNDFGMRNSLYGVIIFFLFLLWLHKSNDSLLQINKSSIF